MNNTDSAALLAKYDNDTPEEDEDLVQYLTPPDEEVQEDEDLLQYLSNPDEEVKQQDVAPKDVSTDHDELIKRHAERVKKELAQSSAHFKAMGSAATLGLWQPTYSPEEQQARKESPWTTQYIPEMVGSLVPLGKVAEGAKWGYRGAKAGFAAIRGLFGKAGVQAAKAAPRAVPGMMALESLMPKTAKVLKDVAQATTAEQAIGIPERIVSATASAGAWTAGHEIGKGEPISAEKIVENAALWSALDVGLGLIGWTGRFTKNLFKYEKTLGQPAMDAAMRAGEAFRETVDNIQDPLAKEIMELVPADVNMHGSQQEVAESVVNFAQQYLEAAGVAPEQAAQTLQHVELALMEAGDIATEVVNQRLINPRNFGTEIPDANFVQAVEESFAHEPKIPRAQRIDLTQQKHALEQEATQSYLRDVAPEPKSDIELVEGLRKDVTELVKLRKDARNAQYDAVRAAGKDVQVVEAQSPKEMLDFLNEHGRNLSGDESYKSVFRAIKTALNDLGYVVKQDAELGITHIFRERSTTVKDYIDVGKLMGSLYKDYANHLNPGFKKFISAFAGKVKNDVRKTLEHNPELLKLYNRAEKTHGELAQELENPIVKKLTSRTTNASDSAEVLSHPEAVRALEGLLPTSELNKVARQQLEHMSDMPLDKAAKYYRNIESFLPEAARKPARELLASKQPGPRQVRKNLKEGVLNELSETFLTSAPPRKTLDAWRTPEGQRIVKEALQGNPNAKNIENYLSRKSIHDLVNKIKDPTGKIEPHKLVQEMNNPEFLAQAEAVGGKPAKEFFETLHKYHTQHVSRFSKAVKSVETHRLVSKGAVAAFNIITGLRFSVGYIGVPVASRILYNISASPRIRQALKDAVLKSKDIQAIQTAANAIGTMLNQEEP